MDDNNNWLIGIVMALLVFVLGMSMLFKATKSQRAAIIGGAILSLASCVFLKLNGWL
jgi:hypothetical protein